MKTTVLMMIVLCASGVFAQDDPTIPKDLEDPAVATAMAACGPDKVKFDVTLTPGGKTESAPAGQALVYMVGDAPPGCGFNCAITTKVGLDGSWVGANHSPSYFSFAVAPGEHHLCVRWQSRFRNRMVALAHFNAEAGKTYYFRSRAITSENFGGYLDVDSINNDQGRFLVASYPLSTSRAKR